MNFQAIMTEALVAGREAAQKVDLPTFHVSDGFTGRSYGTMRGNCGGGMIRGLDRRTAFFRWVMDEGEAHGWYIPRHVNRANMPWYSCPFRTYEQSKAWAGAVNEVLRKHGIKAFASYYID